MKKTLSFLLALIFVVSIASVSLAEFDYSVFEENEYFEVEVDPMNDVGSITIADNFDPFGEPSTDGDIVFISLDMMAIPDFPVLLRMQFSVLRSWPGIEKVILLPDKTRYTAESSLQNQQSEQNILYETFTVPVMPDLFSMFEEIIAKKITSIRYRLDGDQDINGEIPVNLEQLKTLIDLYKAAGGLKQNFSTIEVLFPVSVK